MPARSLRLPMLLVLLSAGCSRFNSTSSAEDLTVCVPSETMALAGLHLDQIRTSAWYRSLPATFTAVLEPFQQASYVVLAYSGNDLLIVARGTFAAAPLGGVLVTPRLALAGPPNLIRAATQQRARGKTGAPALVARTAAIAAKPIWIATRGGMALPLSGNLENINRLLRFTDFVTVTADLKSPLELEAIGSSPTTEAAGQLEEKLRAILTLAKATTHDRDLAPSLASAQLRRDGSVVRLQVAASASALEKLFR